jgi:flagellar basal body-associated protein FliL
MIRPDKKIVRIGTIVLVAAIILLGSGIALYFSNTSSTLELTVSPGSPYVVSQKNVSPGTELQYSVTLTSNQNISVYVLSPKGADLGLKTINTSSTISNIVISNSSGKWSLVILDHGSGKATISATFSDLTFSMIFLIVFGIVLIPSGLVIIYVYFYSRKVEKRRERFRNLN